MHTLLSACVSVYLCRLLKDAFKKQGNVVPGQHLCTLLHYFLRDLDSGVTLGLDVDGLLNYMDSSLPSQAGEHGSQPHDCWHAAA